MSCSDKIARWNTLGLQGAVLAKYISPIYLESIVLGSSYVPFHLHRALFGRLENVVNLPNGYRLNKPKFESTFAMEIINVATPEEYGVCWTDGRKPEILNLSTGLNGNGVVSMVSKKSFMDLCQRINEKLPERSDAGVEQYNQAKRILYDALEKNNFGSWVDNAN